jgi:Na+-translocating ferredoxin:NAD+ oxidoreductase subunit C
MLKTFPKGGVHPPENKLSKDAAICRIPLPATVYIPLNQHLGAPATPIVKKGDRVKTGQLIATSSGFVSASIHSSVTGIVSKIEEIVDSSGYKKPCIIIDTEEDTWEDTILQSEELLETIELTREEIISRVANSGIVGMGGATFPTHIKLSVPPGKKAEYLVINGVECEPYLTSDHRLMLEKPREMLVGIRILMKALQVNQAIIGIENNKLDAIELFQQLTLGEPGIQVVALKVQYPQGGEKQLIKATLNREVPSGGLPVDVGVVVHNVGTAFAVYEAVQKNKPLIERVVTVTGKQIERPSNFLVRIGTPINFIIDQSGGLPVDTGKIINGGPMMGKAITNLEAPVTKGTSGIVLLPLVESGRSAIQPCIRCARCTFVCPIGLEPFLLMTISKKYLWEQAESNSVMDCIECGSCSYTCPCSRPLLDYIRLGKTEVGKIMRSRRKV